MKTLSFSLLPSLSLVVSKVQGEQKYIKGAHWQGNVNILRRENGIEQANTFFRIVSARASRVESRVYI